MVHRNVLYTLALTRSRSTIFKELQSFSNHLITYIFFDGAKFKQLEKNIFEQILITSVLRKTSRVQVQSNVAIRNFLVALKLFLNTKSSLSLCRVSYCKVDKVNWLWWGCRFDFLVVLEVLCSAEKPYILPT